MEFGEQIRALRKREGLSQAQFASRLQVTRQAVSNWENNRNLPDLELLISMSRIVTVQDFVLSSHELRTMHNFAARNGTHLWLFSTCLTSSAVPPRTVLNSYPGLLMSLWMS